ncbi:MFS family permease [Amaricoccus macauensis]|uniref:Multidrug efflux pump Tap n=1 Tax=Amaricoccus macauensis TaxID=57001 RepID=A0A840SVU8_9RHOB|nr:MFS transporter [Amaricoccus macauensis]MBB5223252.1 MFS family permease [Amaricoccus macauensis]
MTEPAGIARDERLLAHRPFLLYFLGRGFSRFAAQMATVALGWQVYELTGSAFHLGLIGLVQFLPMAVLVFVAGHAADRYDRQRVVQICQIVQACAAGYLWWGTLNGWMTVPGIYGAVAVFGMAGAFESPATAALLTGVAPRGQFQRAAALATGMFQLAVIAGPAIGGFAYAAGSAVPYGIMAVFWILGSLLNGAIRLDRPPGVRPAPRISEFFAGIRFVRSDPAILGTISLDLFAVLLGGATALMPIYASDILHTGPWGLGILRAAPAVGALAMTVLLARRTITRRVGMRMLQAVLVFGLATLVFALSRVMWLTLVALIVMGAADTISVVIRTSLVQLRTPDDMRGRVGAVNYLFVNASNQLGEFESGMTAALFGTVPAAVIGGAGTVLVALVWMRVFPSLRRVERLE